MSDIYRMLSLPLKWVQMVKSSPPQIPTSCDKVFISDNVEWSSKYLWKIMSADVKTNIKQEIKDLVLILQIFYRKHLQYYNVKVVTCY